MVDECYNYFENLCVLLLARPNSISVFACMCACVWGTRDTRVYVSVTNFQMLYCSFAARLFPFVSWFVLMFFFTTCFMCVPVNAKPFSCSPNSKIPKI